MMVAVTAILNGKHFVTVIIPQEMEDAMRKDVDHFMRPPVTSSSRCCLANEIVTEKDLAEKYLLRILFEKTSISAYSPKDRMSVTLIFTAIGPIELLNLRVRRGQRTTLSDTLSFLSDCRVDNASMFLRNAFKKDSSKRWDRGHFGISIADVDA
jgi:hypothetical protein